MSVPTDISVQRKPLRWAGTCMNNQPPCCKMNNCKSIPMTPRVTHTRLPEGRQTFKLHAEGEVRLRELTDLTVGLVGSQWESKLTNGIIMKTGSDCVERSIRKRDRFTGVFSGEALWTYPS